MDENVEVLQKVQQGIIDQMRDLPNTSSPEYQGLGKDLINVNKAISIEYEALDKQEQNTLKARELDLKAKELDIQAKKAENELAIAKIESKKETKKSIWTFITAVLTAAGGIGLTYWQTKRVTKFEEEDSISTKAWCGIHKNKF